jgi:hypothetical protein
MAEKAILQLLKPDWKKFILSMLLFATEIKFGLSIITRSYFGQYQGGIPGGYWWKEKGFPLVYQHYGSSAPTFFVFNLIMDIAIYLFFAYFLSCLIISIWDKFIKKNKKQ